MRKNFAFDKFNFILLAVGMLIVIIGFVLMSGAGSNETTFNEDIFSPMRIKVAPVICFVGCTRPVAERWSEEKANAWYASQPWPVGCVYMPSYGGTPVEIWGKEYFKPEVVDSELALAEDLGFNAIRLFLCDVVWQEDPKGFMARLEETVRLADKHGLRILMTFFTNFL